MNCFITVLDLVIVMLHTALVYVCRNSNDSERKDTKAAVWFTSVPLYKYNTPPVLVSSLKILTGMSPTVQLQPFRLILPRIGVSWRCLSPEADTVNREGVN